MYITFLEFGAYNWQPLRSGIAIRLAWLVFSYRLSSKFMRRAFGDLRPFDFIADNVRCKYVSIFANVRHFLYA